MARVWERFYETGATLVFWSGRGVKNEKWVCHWLALSRQEDHFLVATNTLGIFTIV
jgi:hypothetical protein